MPDAMVYATYSKGLSTGRCEPHGRGRYPALQRRFPEELRNRLEDALFRSPPAWNGAFFREDWNDFQYSFLGCQQRHNH